VVEGEKRLERASEIVLSAWIGAHLEVAIHPFGERDALADLESKVLAELDPPLNLDGRPATPIRTELSRLRATMTTVPKKSASSPAAMATPATSRSAPPQPSPEASGITLHDEMVAILRERGAPMTTSEIANAVNVRVRYHRRDGSAIPASQIGARVGQYPHLFGRDGSQIRLRGDA
jgi:hypothetical protein